MEITTITNFHSKVDYLGRKHNVVSTVDRWKLQGWSNKFCRWCGVSTESVTHVYNDCTDLQIQALRHDISTRTGRVLNAECLVTLTDPTNAMEFHDRAIRFLQHGDIVV